MIMVDIKSACQLFEHEEEREGARSAVGGDDAARGGYDDLVTLDQLLELLFIALDLLFGKVAGGVQDDAARVDLTVELRNAIFHIFQAADLILAAVFLRHAHSAVLDDDGGLDVQEVRTEQRDTRATAALVQKFELAEQEAADVLLGHITERLGDMLGGNAHVPELAGAQAEQHHADGQAAAVYDADLLIELTRGDHGVLIGGRHIGAKGDMDDLRIALVEDPLKKLTVLLGSDRGGGGQLLTLFIALEDILGRDVNAVGEVLVIIQNVERRDADIVFFGDISGDIGGAVCGNDHFVHRGTLSVYYQIVEILTFRCVNVK